MWRWRTIGLVLSLVHIALLMAQSPSGTLPVMRVFTDSAVVSKDVYVAGYCEIEGTPMSIPLNLQVKGHGNYTWNHFDKKSYHIKLDSPHTLLGMPENRHFLLLAHADDWLGYLRNTVGFELSRRMQLPYTPRQEPVELVLNDDYLGLYFVTEQIRVDENRVNLIEQLSNDSIHDPEDGGWLVEIDNYSSDNQVVLRRDSSHVALFTIHSPKLMSQVQRDWISWRLSLIDSLVYKSDPEDDGWEEWIDVESLARFYIIQELVDNIEAFHGSCFMTIYGAGDKKLCFGPVWDFGNAFARGYAQELNFIVDGNDGFNKTWIEALTRHPRFVWRVRQIWTDFYENGLTNVDDVIDRFSRSIENALAGNYARWPDYNTDNIPVRWATFKQFLARRVEFLNSQWSLSDVSQIRQEPLAIIVNGREVRLVGGDGPVRLSAWRPDGNRVLVTPTSPTTWQLAGDGMVIVRADAGGSSSIRKVFLN